MQLAFANEKCNQNSRISLAFFRKGERWPKRLVFADFVLTNNFPNNVILSNDVMVYVCIDIVVNQGDVFIKAKKLVTLRNAFITPYVSSKFRIFLGAKLSEETFTLRPSQILAIMMALPMNPFPPISFHNEEFEWYLVPLLHSLKK